MPLSEIFYGPGVRALLTSLQRRCLIQVAVDRCGDAFADELRCQVLLQPRDRRGLPTGSLLQLADEPMRLRRGPRKDEWIGHAWLPSGIEPDLARECYYRLERA